MAYKKILLFLFVVFSFSFCDYQESYNNHKTYTLKIALSSRDLYYSKYMKKYTLKLYSKTPQSEGEEPYQVYDCKTYTSNGVEISGIEPGSGYFLLFKGFSDDNCEKLSVIGFRSNITIAEKEDGAVSGPYYINLFKIGEFSSFPDPALSYIGQLNHLKCKVSDDKCGTYFTELSDAKCSAKSSYCRLFCDSDSDCTKYHPKAVCIDDNVEKYCEFSDTYPLNTSSPRGMHASFSLSDGRIFLVGGTSDESDDFFNPASIPAESFDAITGFFNAESDTYGAGSLIFPTAGSLGGNRFVLAGGATGIKITYKTNTGLNFNLCALPGNKCSVTDKILVYNFNTGSVSTEGKLEFPVILSGMWELKPGTFVLFGGIKVKNNSLLFSSDSFLCNVSSDDKVKCDPYPSVLSGPRIMPETICIKKMENSPITCKRFLIFGGNQAVKQTPIADLMRIEGQGSNFTIKPLPLTSASADDLINYSTGTKIAVTDDGEVYAFGGMSLVGSDFFFGNPDIGAYRLKIDETVSTLAPEKVAISGIDDEKFMRLFHQVVTYPYNNGTMILIIGGITKNNSVSRSVIMLYANEGKLEFVKELKMSKPRFAFTVSKIKKGILKDAYLISGGLTISNGKVVPVYGAELFIPEK